MLAWLTTSLGRGTALTLAKSTAGVFGILLHRSTVHRVVAALAVF